MIDKSIINQLKGIVGEENVLTQKVDLVTYSYDATADVPTELPDVVVMPLDTEAVQKVVKLAREHKIAIYPRGAGTNLSGGTIPLKRGIVLSLQRMNKIVEIDAANLTATVQPGVVIATLNSAVAPYGLIYPPDPGTVATATMGGSVSECSGGLRGLKYGVTKHYIMGMEVVLASGERVRFGGKTVKNVTAYDFASLFVGSEGTLGIITEITCKLIPAPKYRRTMMGIFNTLEDAGNSVAGIIASQVIPATLEIMDNKTIRTIEDFSKIGLPVDAKALLLIEVDGMTEDVVAKEAEAVIEVLKKNNCQYKIANSDTERDQLWAARRNALPALASLNNTCIVEDATVPRSRITDMLVAVENIAKKYNVTIGTFGHAGDGNLHPTILYNKYDKEETERVHKAVDEIFESALKFHGTLSGEHGIGIAKMKYLKDEIGESGIKLMQSIKQAIDPENLFNPGKLVPFKEA
ncbi:MAG TPA: FAD-linked oxidase C-terminal domain-containing protein [Spirochaetota bacterium]|nr:FAD-linked oxidase C-terminal domain-containing protein [Spirochaetota bacterium]HOK93374.1 FAD-linked oxidase C-terminal domain-containing protein [Spirochaetota bacterium]HPP95218.1 FAD-linked oxidase C-terminal domain-containing protein [Spirochaetota bacterium]